MWQTKDFKLCVFGSAASKGVTGRNLGCVANTRVSGEGKALGSGQRVVISQKEWEDFSARSIEGAPVGYARHGGQGKNRLVAENHESC